jgi:adenosylhomocysteine nucleosidase
VTLVVVTGMRREALILARGGEVVISGGENSGLASKLEAAIRRGGRAVISAGICGGLAPGLPVGTAVIATGVIWKDGRTRTDEAWQQAMVERIPDSARGIVAGENGIVADPIAKAALFSETGAIAVDMESHIGARVASAHGLAFAVLRVVCDEAEHTLPPAALGAIASDGRLRIGAVLRSIAVRPMQIPELVRTARNNERAMSSLLRCFNLLGVGLGCPYLG